MSCLDDQIATLSTTAKSTLRTRLVNASDKLTVEITEIDTYLTRLSDAKTELQRQLTSAQNAKNTVTTAVDDAFFLMQGCVENDNAENAMNGAGGELDKIVTRLNNGLDGANTAITELNTRRNRYSSARTHMNTIVNKIDNPPVV